MMRPRWQSSGAFSFYQLFAESFGIIESSFMWLNQKFNFIMIFLWPGFVILLLLKK